MKNLPHRILRKLSDTWAKMHITRTTGLHSLIDAYSSASNSTGANVGDYWCLYQFIRTHKPKEILECGTGVTTVVMAYALKENHKDNPNAAIGRITSMEELPKWYDLAKSLVPDEFKDIIDIRLSDTITDYYSLFRGIRYKDTPNRDYDFVFVDGPDYKARDGMQTFNFDLLHVIQKSDKKLTALVDKRVSSCFVYQKCLGTNIVSYDAIQHIGFVKPCNKHDLLDFPVIPSEAFTASMSLFGSSRLDLRLCKQLSDDK